MLGYVLSVIIMAVFVIWLAIYMIVDSIKGYKEKKEREEFNKMYKCIVCQVVDEYGNVIGVRRNYVPRRED